MCEEHAGKAPVRFSRRQVLAMCLAAPVVGAVAGAGLGKRPAPVVAQTVVPQPTSVQPPVNPLVGMQPTAWGTDLPGITASVPTVPGSRTLALTFDACGGGTGTRVDHELLAVLHEFRVPATLFLNGRWIDANPDLTRQLIADPLFSIQNHGTRHQPLSVTARAAYGIPGTANLDEALAEVDGNRQRVLADFGHDMTWFRSGTAHYDVVCVAMCQAQGIRIAGFTSNLDQGATAAAATVAAQIVQAPDGAIGLGHMNHPGSGTAPGLRSALQQLSGQQLRFVKL